ncbi:hypothetical protein Rs2_26170 [Raphanus sativus]|uniref:Uncharacterized protein LOC108810274 n=1 Tax=Raphanus sativus TaxID=3726 RepID=A0A6J0JQS7_RAPSA|nr:uncharacterized protein LOC108810274 [Raphanus sativus]XP_056852349.1 uncharacterized protein LOC130501443 [Raphanus sativus]KAJ4872989.1 hypothetical protein Rs2_45334 [Raphanus sativus]KAJ4886422.1 hypothetical protein Rs2_26170 [Raphanus sativus]
MKRGRRNVKQAASEQEFTLEECQSIAQVVSLRGSNQIEIMDAKGDKSLALFPAKFRESMWIRRGSFVVIDHTGKQKAQEAGCKVTSIVCKVLFFDQIRLLQNSPEWPQIFRDDAKPFQSSQIPVVNHGEIGSSDDGMPPLEANTNRLRPFGVQCDAETDSDS